MHRIPCVALLRNYLCFSRKSCRERKSSRYQHANRRTHNVSDVSNIGPESPNMPADQPPSCSSVSASSCSVSAVSALSTVAAPSTPASASNRSSNVLCADNPSDVSVASDGHPLGPGQRTVGPTLPTRPPCRPVTSTLWIFGLTKRVIL